MFHQKLLPKVMVASFFPQLHSVLVLLQNAALVVLLLCCRHCDGLNSWFLDPVVRFLAASLLFACFCEEEQEDLNAAVFLFYLEEIRLFFSGRTNLLQRFEIISRSQTFPGLPLSQSYSDHDEAACIFALGRVLNCFYLCGEIIEHLWS